jgi:hypothetical protein
VEFIQIQKDDEYLSPIILYLNHKQGSDSSDPASITDELLNKIDMKERNDVLKGKYLLDSYGLLMKTRVVNFECVYCAVIPQKMKAEVLYSSHAHFLSGHLGLHKTYERLILKYYWRGMFRDTQNYVLSCPQCNARKHPKKTPAYGIIAFVPEGSPWSHVSFDALGPFPTSAKGNKYVMVFTDRFTKAVEFFPVSDIKEEVIAKLMVNEIVPRHGCPTTILSDRAPSFNSKLMEQIYVLLNTNKISTSAYNPSHNGQVERLNETLATMLSMYVNKFQTDWDEYLNVLKGAYMSAPHPVTGYSPNYLEYGRELKLPLDTIVQAKEWYKDGEDFLSRLLQRTSFAQDLARARLLERKVDLEEKQEDPNIRLDYKLGDKVFVFIPDTKVKLKNKLRSRWQGPFSVVERTSPVNYRVMRKVEKDIMDYRLVNVRRMKVYTAPTPLSEEAHALASLPSSSSSLSLPTISNYHGSDDKDGESDDSEEEYEVESIIDKKIVRGKTFYKVKWEGFDDTHNTWEPMEHLVNSSVYVEEYESKQRKANAMENTQSSREQRVLRRSERRK